MATFPERATAMLLVGLSVSLPCPARPAQAQAPREPAVIPAAEASQHLDERCTVELTVRSSLDNERRLSFYLDSEENYRSPENLAVVISYRDARAFREAGIVNPAEHYRLKTIRVTGRVVREPRVNQVRIYVTDPSQIEVVSAPTEAAKAADGAG